MDLRTGAFTLSKREAFFSDLEAKPVRCRDFDEGFFSTAGRCAAAIARTVFALGRRKTGEQYGGEVELEASVEGRTTQEKPLYSTGCSKSAITPHPRRVCGLRRRADANAFGFSDDDPRVMYLPRIRWIPSSGEVLGSEVFKAGANAEPSES